MKEAQSETNKHIFSKIQVVEKQSSKFRQYIFLAGKIFDVGEIGGKIHVYL